MKIKYLLAETEDITDINKAYTHTRVYTHSIRKRSSIDIRTLSLLERIG